MVYGTSKSIIWACVLLLLRLHGIEKSLIVREIGTHSGTLDGLRGPPFRAFG